LFVLRATFGGNDLMAVIGAYLILGIKSSNIVPASGE